MKYFGIIWVRAESSSVVPISSCWIGSWFSLQRRRKECEQLAMTMVSISCESHDVTVGQHVMDTNKMVKAHKLTLNGQVTLLCRATFCLRQ